MLPIKFQNVGVMKFVYAELSATDFDTVQQEQHQVSIGVEDSLLLGFWEFSYLSKMGWLRPEQNRFMYMLHVSFTFVLVFCGPDRITF